MTDKNNLSVLELSVKENNFEFTSSIESALSNAESDLILLNETIESIKLVKPECDKLDYILSAGSGALCGIVDIFLVGKPGESPIGDLTDKWFADRTIDFAKFCGYRVKDNCKDPLHYSINFLERKFKIPYDQSVGGCIFASIINLTPSNHHFKSLGHNPTLLGLFFSILNQFMNTSSFVSDGNLIMLENADTKFELRGNNIPSKIFFGFVNWFGHIISDISGSHSSKTRGMGIPSPIWSWTNDIIAIKNKLKIPVSEFDKSVNDFAIEMFKEGYDTRFQTAQTIPVIINELIVRFFYTIRRFVKYLSDTDRKERSVLDMWKYCEPFSNPTVKRMLTVAHGTFCLIDVADATARGFATGKGSFNPMEFVLRLNIVGIGRFSISLYGEAKREKSFRKEKHEKEFLMKERTVIEYYISGLKELSVIYDDQSLVNFVDDFSNSNFYMQAFKKSVALAQKRNVSQDKMLKNKADIDSYFGGV